MKTKLLIITGLFFVFTNRIQSQAVDTLPPFHGVVVSSGIMLQIERAPQFTLKVTTSGIDTNCIHKTIEDGILTLKIISSLNCRGKYSIDLTCPSIKELEIMGNADVTTKNLLTGDSLKLTLRTGGRAYLDLDINNLVVDLGEKSLITAKGYAVNQKIDVTTSSTFSGFDLEGDYVEAVASFGGKAKVCAAKELKAISKTGGYIGYKCEPASKTLEPKGNGIIEMIPEE